MDENQQKELFSHAYIRAVASVAGYGVHRPEPDDDSVDLVVSARGPLGSYRSPRLDIQVKCTAQDCLTAQEVRFPLKRKNYDDLRGEGFLVPRVLLVIIVPAAIEGWLSQSEEEMILRHCGYWLSLRDAPASDNAQSVTVSIPRRNVFDVAALRRLMETP
jgi:hypothetical protein